MSTGDWGTLETLELGPLFFFSLFFSLSFLFALGVGYGRGRGWLDMVRWALWGTR
jgi:hypothetical protein